MAGSRSLLAQRSLAVLIASLTISATQAQMGPRPPAEPQEMDQPAPSSLPSSNMGSLPLSVYGGSVSQGTATANSIPISIEQAIELGLKNNLGAILTEQSAQGARGARLRALSDLLPNINGRIVENVQQNNLAAFGLNFPGVPTIVGPFSTSDARASVALPIVDLKAWNNYRAANEQLAAAKLSYSDARDIIVLVTANLYLQAISGAARAEAAAAQLKTAQTAFEQAQHLRDAGVVAGVDVLRAQVELQSRKQQLVARRNDFAKDKLDLARAIGLPPGQEFELSDKMPYAQPAAATLEVALQRAYDNRTDWKRAQAMVRAAELSKKAASAGYLPSLRFDGDYGVLGRTFGSSHGTFLASTTLKIPIFNGGKTRAEVVEQNAEL